MSKPAARVLLDSMSEVGDRITTVEVKHHRFILAETNTHRALSRNSASSRAIPLKKMLERFEDDPAYPVVYRSEQSGMSGGSNLDPLDRKHAQSLFSLWNDHTLALIHNYIADLKVAYGEEHYQEHALHKSWINRLMEPMQWHTAIWTFDHNLFYNFLEQRAHKDAQPEFLDLALALIKAMDDSKPTELGHHEWHTPLIQPDEYDLEPETRLKVSVARCARVSYLTHDGKREIAKDLELHDRLARQSPPHASPFEHVCTPAPWNKQSVTVPRFNSTGTFTYQTPRVGNLYGWLQLRHSLGMP